MKTIYYCICTFILLGMILPVTIVADINMQGLWYGQVEMNKVNEVSSTTDTQTPTPVFHPFDMHILLHMDAAGKVNLLRNVTVMRKPIEGETAYQRVLVTDDSLIPQYEGISRRDGKMIGIRYSCLGFDFDKTRNEFLLNGQIGAGKTISGTISLSEDHPTNPFRHMYHPDHQSGRSITRSLSLTFDENQASDPDAGSFFLTGLIEETVTGLHKIPIKATGILKLQRISVVNTLNE